jgi:protein TonB
MMVPELIQCVLPETAVVGADPAAATPARAAGSGAGGEGENATPDAGPPGSGSIAGNAGGAGAMPGDAAGRLTLAKPRYASNPKPEYPRLARQNRWEGVVYLRAAISDTGEVESVEVESSSGYQLLDRSAVGGVSRWRFVPARRGEREVPCEVRIPVAFQLDR